MITISKLQVGYNGIEVLNEFNLTLEQGMIHGLVGLNGSGKSTLMRCMAGLIRSESGDIKLDGRQLKRTDVSLLETEPYFYHGITGREYLMLFKNPITIKFDLENWAQLFSIPLDKLIDGYSTGMKKKLALLAVLKMDRPVVLLDEPFNGLDLESVRTLSTLLANWSNPGKVILLSSHILDTLRDSCSRIHYLSNGKIQYSFSGTDMADMENIIFKDFDQNLNDKISGLMN